MLLCCIIKCFVLVGTSLFYLGLQIGRALQRLAATLSLTLVASAFLKTSPSENAENIHHTPSCQTPVLNKMWSAGLTALIAAFLFLFVENSCAWQSLVIE